MAASVVGFDIGNSTSYIAIAKGGGIETIDNEYSDRCTPSYVTFNEKTRVVGVAAKQSAVTNIKNTVYNYSRFIGKSFSDPAVKREFPLLPYKIVELPNDKIGIEVRYLNKAETFTPEQILSAQLTKLKQITESHTNCPIFDVVINCPSFYTDRERWAILDASRVSGLNCTRLINDTTAIGLSYGLYNQDIPDADKAPRKVAFVLMGQSNLQIAICAFNKGKLKILSTSADPSLGGRDFDLAIYEQMCKNFKEKYNIDVRSNSKATLKLFIECEKSKKLMSANSTPIPINIESLMEDKDVASSIKRADFEELIAGHLERAEQTMVECMEKANCKPEDITFVEMVGGSTRIPSIKSLIKKVFKQEGRTTLNADEAIARGCALQAAIISPAFKVKEFSIIDACPYSITIRYPSYKDENKTEMFEIFPHLNPIPITRQITIKQKKDFVVEAFYTDGKVWNQNKNIGSFKICNVKPQGNNPDIEVKLKIRICGNGTLSISSAQLIEKHEREEIVQVEEEKKPMEVEGEETPSAGENKSKMEEEPSKTEEDKKKKEPAEPKKVKKIVNKNIDVPIEGVNAHMNDADIQNFIELEGSIIAQERLQKEKDNAKNSLEEYIYEMRDKVSGPYADYILKEDRENFSSSLTKLEEWLYEDGEDASRQIYVDRLKELRVVGDVYQIRYWEAQNLPSAINRFNQVLDQLYKIVELHKNGDEKYSHIPAEEMKQVTEAMNEKRKWVDDGMALQKTKKKTDDPIIFTNQIIDHIGSLEKKCIPIINKPKPPPPKTEKKEEKKAKTNGENKDNGEGPTEPTGNDADLSNGKSNGNKTTTAQEANHTMDVD